MINFGIIGTNFITKQFIAAAENTGRMRLTAVYSRTQAKAQAFASAYRYVTATHDDLADFFADDSFSTVYIASPNSLHFDQACQAITAGKNVILEKPATTSPAQMQVIQDLLQAHPQVHFFEAARHIHEPNFKVVQEQVAKFGQVQGANLTYEKYSSKFDSYLAGNNPNVFTLEFAGGALQDLGVYLVYEAVALFGMPQASTYVAQKLESGVDGKGTAILDYGDFKVVLNMGKMNNSYLPGEIYAGKQTLILANNAADMEKISLVDAQGQVHVLANNRPNNPMTAEINDFADVLESPTASVNQQKEQAWLQLAVQVNRVMYDFRQSAQIEFPTDNK